MKSIAIIGTGIAGMTCGHSLHPRHDITLYEREDEAGGHAHTLMVNEGGHALPVDTGFMVYNETTYPELTRLFTQLGVQMQSAPLSFSVQDPSTGLDFSTANYDGIFAQRKNICRPRFWKMLLEIRRFNRQAPEILGDLLFQNYTLREYVEEMHFSDDFLNFHLLPIGSAIWSLPSDLILDFPAPMLVQVFKQNGFLGWKSQLSWRTVTGGSRVYRDAITRPFRDRVRLKRPAVLVTRREGAVQVIDSTRDARSYDHVIFACHADEALALLANPSTEHRALLPVFRYQDNTATLHTDSTVMPKTRRAWSSVNYRSGSVTYWINRLQGTSENKDYFLSMNIAREIAPARVVTTLRYRHPVFSPAVIHAQKNLSQLNQDGLVSFCGSYFGYGFHEDALQSALAVCRPFEID